MSSARGQYNRASLEDDDLIDPDDGRARFLSCYAEHEADAT